MSKDDREFLVGLARACAGALIFSLPMLMTMEMWRIGFYVGPWKLVLLAILLVPLLTCLSYWGGFKRTETVREDIVDAFVAIAVASVIAAAALLAFGVLEPGMSVREIVGKVALQAFPGSIGAMLSRSQMGREHEGEEARARGGAQEGRTRSVQGASGRRGRRRNDAEAPGYFVSLFLMSVGALFLGLNVAPTEEMILISYQMGPVRLIVLVLLSLVIMHGFVYAVEFTGGHKHPEDTGFWSVFMRFTIAGYGMVLLTSLYMLWTFGRIEGAGMEEMVSACVVLGFPCAIGAAAARLIL